MLSPYAFVSQSGAGPERQSTCRARGRKSSRFFCAMQLRYAPIQKARRTRHSISKPLTPVWRCGHLSSTSPLFGSERHGSAYTCARSYRDTLRCVLPTFFNASSSRECLPFTAIWISSTMRKSGRVSSRRDARAIGARAALRIPVGHAEPQQVVPMHHGAALCG